MSDEELKYCRALQPFFRERMGEWQVGDMYAMGNKILFVDENNINKWWRSMNVLFIPRPIDTENPERGLLGMIENLSFIYPLGSQWVVYIKPHEEVHFVAETPALALLKALAVQWGVTV